MGVDINQLPAHVQKQIRDKKPNGSGSALHAKDVMNAKAVPHDHRMNKTEKNYSNHLESLKIAGDIKDWKHEPFNLRLADRTFYKPDFVVINSNDHIEIHEVKGYAFRDDALVKIKVAAENFPWFKFVGVFWRNRKWEYRSF